MNYEGSMRVAMRDCTHPDIGGKEPAVDGLYSWKRTPHGLTVPNVANECMLEFTTENDMQATLEADPNVITLYWYEESA